MIIVIKTIMENNFINILKDSHEVTELRDCLAAGELIITHSIAKKGTTIIDNYNIYNNNCFSTIEIKRVSTYNGKLKLKGTPEQCVMAWNKRFYRLDELKKQDKIILQKTNNNIEIGRIIDLFNIINNENIKINFYRNDDYSISREQAEEQLKQDHKAINGEIEAFIISYRIGMGAGNRSKKSNKI